MFTGIVQALCAVVGVSDSAGLRRLEVALGDGALGERLQTGASVAVNGTCLTVVAFERRAGSGVVALFDCIAETLARTTLGALAPGDRVNVERAMAFGDEVGGHMVSGHVDCTGVVHTVETTPNNRTVFVAFPEEYAKFLVPKGWIAIDGISLTVVAVEPTRFSVSLIPETLARTTLGFKGEGARVNLEFDGQTKIAVLTMERLLPQLLAQQQPR